MSGSGAGGRTLDPAAIEALSSDPLLGPVIERVGDFEPAHEPDLWWSLVDAIASQQLSVKAAATIVSRIGALSGAEPVPTPAELLAVPDEQLRACGLSRAKVAYVKDLAARFADRSIRPEVIAALPDEDVVTELTRVKGVGRWTAEMILIFTLRRPDVFPVDDLGLRTAVQRVLGLAERPAPREVAEIGEPWRPYRSTATLYLWRSLTTP